MMRARSFSDDADAATVDAKAEPEYVFDGFNVEFSTKIALTPPSEKVNAPKPRQDTK
jgi:hypothetical protein